MKWNLDPWVPSEIREARPDWNDIFPTGPQHFLIMKHQGRRHSKFSASGSERWFNCPSSVALSEGLPDQDTVWSLEGTKAHELLELRLLDKPTPPLMPAEMEEVVARAAQFIFGIHASIPNSELYVEDRVRLDFIHPEMFGTYDAVIVDHFGRLDVFDFKYGAGHAVSPANNLQMIFYGLGLAHKFGWNFSRVRLWIIQPRIKGYDGPVFWELEINELKAYIPKFKEAVDRVVSGVEDFKEGPWCWFCKAKSICPLKTAGKIEAAKSVFATADNSSIFHKAKW